MDFEAARAAVAVTFLLIASFFDLFNRKNVPIWVPGGMLITGGILDLATGDVSLILTTAATAGAIFSIGYLIFRIGQIGGADVLVFTALALLLPSGTNTLLGGPEPMLPYPPILPILVVSGLLGMVGLALRYIPIIGRRLLSGKLRPSAGKALMYFIAIVVYSLALAALLAYNKFSPFQAAAILLLVLLAGFLTMFRDEISASMVEWVPLGAVDDEDVIQLSLLSPALVKRLKLQPVLTPQEVEKLKKTGLHLFPVFKGMPAFLPYVLLATLLFLAFGDPLTLFLI